MSTGTGRLVGLALRRDRLRLAIWIAALTATMLYAPMSLAAVYPDAASRQARVDMLKTPAGIILGGPVFGRHDTELGTMIAGEMTLTVIVAMSILAILTVVRHTRAEEESGAAELVLAAPVGRHARTCAALVVVGGVDIVLTATMTAALAVAGLAVTDAAAMCLGAAAVATLFGAAAAVAAQIWRQARTATGAAMAALGLAVLVRGVGDVIEHSGSALSWFSPIAWAQQMRAFAGLRWWPLTLVVLATAVLVTLAVVLESRRQYDAGLAPDTGDRPGAPRIRTLVGLQLYLQRGQLAGWGAGLALAGLTFGSMTRSLADAARTNDLIARMLTADGYDGIYTTMTQFLAAAAGVYVVSAVLRVYGDERSGIGEIVLAGPVSRPRWLGSAVGGAVLGGAALMLVAGVGNGLGAGLALGEPATVARLALAALAFVPALAVLAAVAALAVALTAPGIAWLTVTFVVTALYLGALLRFPRWLIDVSPVARTTAPSSFSVPATAVLTAVAAALALVAAALYRRRDAA